MVGNDFKRDIVLFIRIIFHTGKLTRFLDNRLKQISIKVRIDILQNRSETLQTCACINIFIRQRCIAAVFIMVELRENNIPHFQEPLILAAGPAFRIGQVAVFIAAVVENFRTRAARAFADIPEVISSSLINALFRNTNFFIPNLESFLVFRMNRHRDTIRIKADPLGIRQKFPSPGNGFFLEIIADREIAEHFEESMMAACFPDILDIIGANTFLSIGDPRIIRNLASVKIRLSKAPSRH